MKTIITSIICFIFCLNSTKTTDISTIKEENKKQDFNSFLNEFDLFNKPHLDISFFKRRNKRESEQYTEINKTKYSPFIPYDNTCNCEKDELYYHPCYRKETVYYHIVAILGSCDIPATVGYPFDVNIIVTYDKKGCIIDYATTGTDSDIEYHKMVIGEKENEYIITQYYFKEIKDLPNTYSGECDITDYKLVINTNGTIDKFIIREYTDNVTIYARY